MYMGCARACPCVSYSCLIEDVCARACLGALHVSHLIHT